MAIEMEKLPVNYRDDMIDTSVNEKRKYEVTENPDGTKTLEDVTVYKQVGSLYGAEDINRTNRAINQLIEEAGNNREDFILANQLPLEFSENVCAISDERITAGSLADVYFTSDTVLKAEKASITVETYNGRVELKAGRMPEGTIKASIVIKVV